MKISSDELKNILSGLDIEAFITDDKSLDPVEYLVFLSNKKDIRKAGKAFERNTIISECSAERILRFIDLSRLCPDKKLLNAIRNRSDNIGSRLYKLDGDDLGMLLLSYIFFLQQIPDWLTENAFLTLGSNIPADKREHELFERVLDWYNKNGCRIRTGWIRFPRYFFKYGNVSGLTRLRLKINEYFSNLRLVMTSRLLHMHTILHRLLKTKGYLHYVSSALTEAKQLTYLRDLGESISGCTFMSAEIDGEKVFIKGNDVGAYCALENEIFVQKRLIEQGTDEKLFLLMKGADQSGKYIIYPFCKTSTLRDMISSGIINSEDTNRIGKFLVIIIEKLHNMGIVHRDLRPENISVELSADGRITSLRLLDFGCSYAGGTPLWSDGSFWSKYFSRYVCGEFRYSERLVDDAAAAYLIYLLCGGSCEDDTSKKLRQCIGRHFV